MNGAAGFVVTRQGRTLGVAGFTVASLLCGLAPSATALDVARGLQGIGGAAMFATSLALIAQEFRGRELGTGIAAWGSTVGAAVAAGPLIGGALTEVLGWQWIFFVNVPIGVAALTLAVLRMREFRDEESRRLAGAPELTRSDRVVPDLAYARDVPARAPTLRTRLTVGLSPSIGIRAE